MQKRSAEEVLGFMIKRLLEYIEELKEYQDEEGKQFEYGERVAYTECIEWIENWEKSKERGLNFNIEEKYPIEKITERHDMIIIGNKSKNENMEK